MTWQESKILNLKDFFRITAFLWFSIVINLTIKPKSLQRSFSRNISSLVLSVMWLQFQYLTPGETVKTALLLWPFQLSVIRTTTSVLYNCMTLWVTAKISKRSRQHSCVWQNRLNIKTFVVEIWKNLWLLQTASQCIPWSVKRVLVENKENFQALVSDLHSHREPVVLTQVVELYPWVTFYKQFFTLQSLLE